MQCLAQKPPAQSEPFVAAVAGLICHHTALHPHMSNAPIAALRPYRSKVPITALHPYRPYIRYLSRPYARTGPRYLSRPCTPTCLMCHHTALHRYMSNVPMAALRPYRSKVPITALRPDGSKEPITGLAPVHTCLYAPIMANQPN